MSIFCHPEVLEKPTTLALLGIESNTVPEFGFKPRTPLHSGKRDNTEIDMKLGDLLVEAKLTESDFQSAGAALISRYRDVDVVFDVLELPHSQRQAMRLSVGSRRSCSQCHGLQLLCFLRRAPPGSDRKLVQNYAGRSFVRASLSTQAAHMAGTGLCSTEGCSAVLIGQIRHFPGSSESRRFRLKRNEATSPSLHDRPSPAAGRLGGRP